MPTKNAVKNQSAPGRKAWLLICAGWLMSSMLLIGVDQARILTSRNRILRYKEGDLVTVNYDLDSDFSFIDFEATEKVININKSLVPPVYNVRGEMTDSVLDRYDRFLSLLKPAYTPSDTSILQNEFPGAGQLISGTDSRTAEQTDRLTDISGSVLQTIQYGGVFRLDPQDGGSASGLIEVIYDENRPERRVTLSRDAVVTPENLSERVYALDELADLSFDDKTFISALAVYFAGPNAYYNAALSAAHRDEAAQAAQPVMVSYSAGTRLLSAGTVVTALQARAIEELRDQRSIGYRNVPEPLLYMAFLFALGLVLSRLFGTQRIKDLWLYAAFGGVYIVLAALLMVLELQSIAVYMPTALFSLILTQMVQNRRLAVTASLLMALFVLFVSSGSIPDFMLTLAAGLGGVLVVYRGDTRMGLLRAGLRLAILQALTSVLAGFLTDGNAAFVFSAAARAAVNGLLTGTLSLALLPLLEHLLNTATTFRLIELSDQNVPVLKRMRLQAPGTYIHSQNVAHLSEAACEAIGANGLLARVGAYYHDIGKVDQAQFFVENQAGENRHDEMKASLSAAVIKSHVKIGMEKGRELRLPDEVLAVIEQHHGTSVIRYFYDRAQKEKGEAANPGDFSYGGPRPLSREAGVVMLADSAEAATRTLKKPTVAKLEKYVWDLIMDRFRTGELGECDLTLKELEIIKNTFVHVLTGHFHTRIEYPAG